MFRNPSRSPSTRTPIGDPPALGAIKGQIFNGTALNNALERTVRPVRSDRRYAGAQVLNEKLISALIILGGQTKTAPELVEAFSKGLSRSIDDALTETNLTLSQAAAAAEHYKMLAPGIFRSMTDRPLADAAATLLNSPDLVGAAPTSVSPYRTGLVN